MTILSYIWWGLFYAINAIVALYFLVPVLLFILHYVLGVFLKKRKKITYEMVTGKQFDFAAIITAHQDFKCVPPLIDSFIKQRYENFVVYVVADDCQQFDPIFNDDRVIILQPPVPFHAKIKSIKLNEP